MNEIDLPPEFERPSLLQGLRSLWLGSERFRCFVRGLPAVVAGIAVVLAACEVRLFTETELLAHYSSEADRLVRAGNHEAALLCAERMALIRPSKPDYVYQQMLRLEAMGQPERALTLARKIAPDHRPGYAPAHLWIAHHLLQQDRRTPEVLRAAESHLRLYLRTFPESETEAHALLGLLYSATGRPVEAEVHLQKAVVRQPSLLLPLARACNDQGKKAAARSWAQRACDHFLEQSTKDSNDHEARLRATAALMFLEKFQEAEALLNQGLSRLNDPRYHITLAQLYVTWSAVSKRNNEPIDAQFELLERGLRHNPANQFLINQLLDILQSGGSQADKARASLRAALTGGKGTAVIHFALGMDAWNRGKPEEAKLHWEEARALAPEMPSVANNLAWALAFGHRPDLSQALELINPVVERWPNVAAYRDTRGRILAKLERWKEALPDLEAALRAYSSSPELHETLAATYEHLGLPEIAAEHRRQAGGGKVAP